MPRQDIIDKFEAMKLMFDSKLTQFKKENADEILDLREEQRFKIQSLMDCLNSLAQQSIQMKSDILDKDKQISALQTEKDLIVMNFND